METRYTHIWQVTKQDVVYRDRCAWQIESVLKIPMKQQVFSCVHMSGGITIFSLYDCHMLDIRQINDWTKETNAIRLDHDFMLIYSTVALVPPMSTMYVWRGIT